MAQCPECATNAAWRPAFRRAAACHACGTRLRIRKGWLAAVTAGGTAVVVAAGGAVIGRGFGWLLVVMAATMLIFLLVAPLLPLERGAALTTSAAPR
jgi:uncharacterized protein (DUF983 family)